MNTMSDFPRKLRQLRLENHLTQEKLRAELNAQGYDISSISTISRWESGSRIPKTEIVEDLESILGANRGLLLRAARYLVEISPEQSVSSQIDPVIGNKREEHFVELASTAKTLLTNGLDNVSHPGWSTNRSLLGKYLILNENAASGYDEMTKEQLSQQLNQNMKVILKHKDWFFRYRFVPYVKSKLGAELKPKRFDEIIEEQPYQLIEVVRRLAYGEIL